jgi:hypothetical protein
MFFIPGGIAAAAAIQELYERAFALDRRGARDMLRGAIWLAVLVGCSVLAGWAGPGLRSAGGPVLLAVVGGDRRGFCAHVLADRYWGRDHFWRGDRHRVAGTEPVVEDCPQETAAEPGRAASQETLTERRATASRR